MPPDLRTAFDPLGSNTACGLHRGTATPHSPLSSFPRPACCLSFPTGPKTECKEVFTEEVLPKGQTSCCKAKGSQGCRPPKRVCAQKGVCIKSLRKDSPKGVCIKSTCKNSRCKQRFSCCPCCATGSGCCTPWKICNASLSHRGAVVQRRCVRIQMFLFVFIHAHLGREQGSQLSPLPPNDWTSSVSPLSSDGHNDGPQPSTTFKQGWNPQRPSPILNNCPEISITLSTLL